jgi:hypothetical protein
MKRHINFWVVMFLAISLALPIYSMAQTTLTLESYTTGDRISGGTIKSFSLGADNNLVVYLDGPFNFAELAVPIWIQTSGPCSSTVPSPYPPPSVAVIQGDTSNFVVCSSANAGFTMPVSPEPGVATFTPTAGTGTFNWNTGGTEPVSKGSYLAVFQATDGGDTSQLVVMIKINPPETVNPPTAISPTTGTVNQAINFTASGASTSLQHAVAYRFSFDGGSSWSSWGSSAHTFTSTGQFTVQAQARCVTDYVESTPYSTTVTISDVPVETISTPGTPSGTASGTVNTSYNYTTTGATLNPVGHTVQYRFIWGDGTSSSWSTSTSATKFWSTANTYSVTVEARCATDTIITKVSSALSVTITSAGGNPGALGSKTNPIPMNQVKIGSRTYTYYPSSADQNEFSMPGGGSKIYFSVDTAVTGKSISYFTFSVQGFNNPLLVYTKLPQTKAGVDLVASEIPLGNNTGDTFNQVTNKTPYDFSTTRWLYAIQNLGAEVTINVTVQFMP